MDPTHPKTPSLPSDDSVPPDISDTQVLNHITQHLFECDEERAQALHQWIKHSGFEHILNVIDYLAVNPEKNIKDLGQYKYGNKTMDLKTFTRHQLKILARWSREQTSTLQQSDLPRSTWLNLTKANYDHWRINADFTKLRLNQGCISSFRLAKREVLRLNNYISNLRLDDSWHGTTYQFLLHFQHQFHLLDNLGSMFDHIPGHSTRMTFLMKAVEKVPDLRQVNILSGAKTLCYQSYFRLLLNAAYDHDQATQAPKSNRLKHTKQCDFQYDQDFDIKDLSPKEKHRMIKRTNVKTKKSSSLRPKISLPRDLWSKLNDNSRQVIIAYNKSTQNPSSTTACMEQTHTLDIDPEPDPDPGRAWIDDMIQDDSQDHQDNFFDLITRLVPQVVTNIDVNHPTSDLANLVSNIKATSIPNDCLENNNCKQKVEISRHLLSRMSIFSGDNQLTGYNHWYLDPMQDTAPSSRTVENDGNNPHDAFGKYTNRVVCNLNLLLDLPYDHGPDTPSFFTPLLGEYCSKPYLQDQNMAENRYQTVKRTTYVVTISGHIPLEILNGHPPGITHPLFFLIWDKAPYFTESYALSHRPYRPYPPSFVTTLGYWLVFAPPIGDTLSLDTQTLCYSAILHDAPTPPSNLCVDTSSGEESLPNKPIFICSKGEDPSTQMPMIKCDNTIGQPFLVYDPEENGEQRQPYNGEQPQPCLIRCVIDLEQDALKQEDCIKYTFCKSISNIDKIISYRQHMEYIKQDNQAQETEDDVFQFRDVVADQEPSSISNNPDYKRSHCNILVDWETGEMIYEPPSLMVNDAYAKKHDLLNELGWKHLKRFVKTSKCLVQAAKQQSRIKQVCRSIKYKFGYQVSMTNEELVVLLDKQHGKRKWHDTTEVELFQASQIQSLTKVKDCVQAQFKRREMINASPEEYHKNKIQIHLVKHDDSRPALLITDEAFTKEPVEAIFLCTTSIHNFHTTTSLGILNDMDIWGAEVGNAHDLEALSGEKILIVARQELKESGHILITHKASKGLKSSGACRRDCFFDIPLDMDLSPTKADPNVWMKKAPGEHSSKGTDKTYQLKNDELITYCLRYPYESVRDTLSVSIGNSRKYGPRSRSYSSGEETFRSMTRKITILTRRIVGSVRILTFN